MKELTLADILRAGAVVKRSVPSLEAVYVFGSGSVAVCHPDVAASLRRSVDVDMAPVGRALLYFDSKFVDQYGGPESDFGADHGFYVDYVTPDLLRCTPPGWQERVTVIELAPGLEGRCLDPHDVAYNKLWAGRPKDITWVKDLLATGIISLARLEELHQSNPIAKDEHDKVSRSLLAIR